MKNEERNNLEVGKLFERLPQSRSEIWDILRHFFSGWLGALGPGDCCSSQSIREVEQRLGIVLPTALREWYELAGLRESVWSRQDRFLTPPKLRIEDERLIIYVENQSVVKWGIPLEMMGGDDAPVYVSDPEDPDEWIEETPGISVFALSQMLLAVKFSEKTFYSANGQATDGALAAIAKEYERLDFPDLRWPLYPTRFFGGQDLLIETDAQTWIWISGRSTSSFQTAVELIAGSGVCFEQITES